MSADLVYLHNVGDVNGENEKWHSRFMTMNNGAERPIPCLMQVAAYRENVPDTACAYLHTQFVSEVASNEDDAANWTVFERDDWILFYPNGAVYELPISGSSYWRTRNGVDSDDTWTADAASNEFYGCKDEQDAYCELTIYDVPENASIEMQIPMHNTLYQQDVGIRVWRNGVEQPTSFLNGRGVDYGVERLASSTTSGMLNVPLWDENGEINDKVISSINRNKPMELMRYLPASDSIKIRLTKLGDPGGAYGSTYVACGRVIMRHNQVEATPMSTDAYYRFIERLEGASTVYGAFNIENGTMNIALNDGVDWIFGPSHGNETLISAPEYRIDGGSAFSLGLMSAGLCVSGEKISIECSYYGTNHGDYPDPGDPARRFVDVEQTHTMHANGLDVKKKLTFTEDQRVATLYDGQLSHRDCSPFAPDQYNHHYDEFVDAGVIHPIDLPAVDSRGHETHTKLLHHGPMIPDDTRIARKFYVRTNPAHPLVGDKAFYSEQQHKLYSDIIDNEIILEGTVIDDLTTTYELTAADFIPPNRLLQQAVMSGGIV